MNQLKATSRPELFDDRTCNQVAGCSLAPDTPGFQPRRAKAPFTDYRARVSQPSMLETLVPLRRFPLKPLPSYHLVIRCHIVLSIGVPAESTLDPPVDCSKHGLPFFRSQTSPLTESGRPQSSVWDLFDTTMESRGSLCFSARLNKCRTDVLQAV